MEAVGGPGGRLELLAPDMTCCHLPRASRTQGPNPEQGSCCSRAPNPTWRPHGGRVPCLAPHHPYSCVLAQVSAQK